MNRYASFFKGCRFKNTIVDGYSVIAPHVVGETERQLNEEDTRLVVTDIKGKPIRDMPSTRGEIFVFRFHQLDCT